MSGDAQHPTAVEADHWGDLDRAVALASGQVLRAADTTVEQRVANHLLLARVLRHRGLGDDLRRAKDAAQQAQRLASLPTSPSRLLPHTRLSLAGTLLALGDEAQCRRIAEAHVRPGERPAPDVAAWAWRLLGQAALTRSDVFEAVAALLNARAEEQLGPTPGAHTTRVLLLSAFSRAGHVLDADQVARQTNLGELPPHPQAAFLLTHAEHLHRYGRIAEALDDLGRTEVLLRAGSSLDRLRARLHRLRAACLDDWCLDEEARAERRLARQLTTWGTPAPPVGPVAPLTATPARPAPVPLTPDAPGQRPVIEIVQEFGRLRKLEKQHIRELEQAVARLHGIPGEERAEALALVEAGSLLAHSESEHHPTAQRLLRRALARLDYLEGTDLWRARCQHALGLLLAERAPEQALDLLLAAIRTLNDQRHQMPNRSHRSTWRERAERPPFGAAIELAHRLGRDALAADLIIHSRLTGVVSPAADGPRPPRRERVDEVPLKHVPQLHYVDDTRSALGGPGACRFL